MNDGSEEDWQALARLTAGQGSHADFELLAREFRTHHLQPELMRLPAMLWLDLCLERLLAGEKPAQVFVKKRTGRPVLYTVGYRAYVTLLYEQLKRTKGIAAAQTALLDRVRDESSDFRGIERTLLLPRFGANWSDAELQKRLDQFAHHNQRPTTRK